MSKRIETKRRAKFPELKRASLESMDRVVLVFRDTLPFVPSEDQFSFSTGERITKVIRLGVRRLMITGGPFDPARIRRIQMPDGREFPLHPDGILDRYRTDKQLGLIRTNREVKLRLFAPRARSVSAYLFEDPEAEKPLTSVKMDRFDNGVWGVNLPDLIPGSAYAYRVKGPDDAPDLSNIFLADPYSQAVVKRNTWRRESRSIVLHDDLLKPNDTEHVTIPSRDLVIYEAHVKDFSKLSQKVPHEIRGTYLGAFHDSNGSPFNHIRELGINAVEWLPLADYDHIEPTYNDKRLPVWNTWNPYSFNHWGYMPAFYFAPEARYASGFSEKKKEWIGFDARQITQFKELVKAYHEAGIAVIVDVVYNHVAQYGENPIRMIDPFYSLRYSREGHPQSISGCGNDLRTERPMIRRMIVESLKHWLTVFGVDGFRFDLAGLIDADTLGVISRELRAIYPEIHLIAEPWGGRYDKSRFSKVGWASWNDHFRDSIRGTEPEYGKGFALGSWSPRDGGDELFRQFTGNRVEDGGPFKDESHSVNFISCHDGYTFADFVRVATNSSNGDEEKVSREQSARIDSRQDRIIRLGMLILLTSRGSVMMHQGDEWGWSKIIEQNIVNKEMAGLIDHNSYEKDDATNWLDWSQLRLPVCNKLNDYVKGLIRIRNQYRSLRLARRNDVTIIDSNTEYAIGFHVEVALDDIIVAFNGNSKDEAIFSLPHGRWRVIADHREVISENSKGSIRKNEIVIPHTAGAILIPDKKGQ